MQWLLSVEVANWKIVSILAVLSVLAAAGAFMRRRHLVAFTGLALAAATLAGADTVNTYYGYLPQLADVVGATEWQVIPARDVLAVRPPQTGLTRISLAIRHEGGVVSLPITGQRSHFGRHGVLVYLPPAYFTDPARRFPVVYLLHGSPGRPEDWLRAGRLTHVIQPLQSTAPLIVVMPPMSEGWLDDSECVNGRREHIETWLVEDVVPRIDRDLRTLPDRAHRGLAGMSAGGYCALNLAVRDSGVFGSALDMSGYTEPTYDGGLRSLFGTHWQQAAAQNTPRIYLATHPVMLPLHIRIDVGRDDPRPLRETRALLPDLQRHEVDATLVTRPGSHTYHVWVPALRNGLQWLATLLSDGPAAAPART